MKQENSIMALIELKMIAAQKVEAKEYKNAIGYYRLAIKQIVAMIPAMLQEIDFCTVHLIDEPVGNPDEAKESKQ